ncbi:hypothetical protein KR054_002266 [Drosophila jambulina]|nr:hypothetical protein KR054_002266 [Drosophila jambulina]
MLAQLITACLLGQLLLLPVEASTSVNCSNPLTDVAACGRFSANGCCAKGCMRNPRGRCVQEQCTDSWSPWLSRPMTMSCYFHWFVIIFAGFIALLMFVLVMCNLGCEVGRCIRQRRHRRFRPFRDLSGISIGSTQC